MTISERLSALRSWMECHGRLGAFIVPTADPHNSEYLARHWQCREWLTGFTGSAGLAIVAPTAAALWTDSRYWLQAAEELRDTPFALMRDGDATTPTPAEWLAAHVAEGQPVGFFAETLTMEDYCAYRAAATLNLVPCAEDAFAEIWTDRPPLPTAPVSIQPQEFAGASVDEKMRAIWQQLRPQGFHRYWLCDLSEIAWTLNLRGADVEFNPVFLSYLLLEEDGSAILFADPEKFNPDVRRHLEACRVTLAPYADWRRVLRQSGNLKQAMSKEANTALFFAANDSLADTTLADSPVPALRMVKTEAEQTGFRRSMERDGVALVRFLRQLDDTVATARWDELEADRVLTSLRAEQENFCGLSFATIAAYGPHGAIVHYEASPATSATLQPRSLLLLDSGAQYRDGTTDITRTIALGPTSPEERRAYTLVLKAHIALASARFPEGTTGLALDAQARQPLWQAGYDFGHGTGHGVGSYLCVHEGPHQIRKNVRACTQIGFRPGMVITDEPGIYAEGKFGVRIENVLLCVPDEETPFGRFCRFETLTLCPIDLSPVCFDLLTPQEIDWLNAYHAEVRRRLLPLLSDAADRQWLNEATKSVEDHRHTPLP